jgi:hypothetical protein
VVVLIVGWCPTARAEAPNLLRLPVRAARRLPDHADDKLTAFGILIGSAGGRPHAQGSEKVGEDV